MSASARAGTRALCKSACPLHGCDALKAILFDKDGTLVDFHATWGAATYATMHRMAKGDADKLARLAEANHYDLERRLIRPPRP